MLAPFINAMPRIEDYWRGIILFGRNSASYKFALAKALLELRPHAGQLIKLHEIAPLFANQIVAHLKKAPKQAVVANTYLDLCRVHGIDSPDKNKLIDETVRRAFTYVIDAFHVIGQSAIEKPFFIDERSVHNGIRITDEFSALMTQIKSENLDMEVESRWNLVETAWSLGVASNLIEIKHDPHEGMLYTFDKGHRRKSVTGARGALNGYQKGKCFYCRCDIDITTGRETEVDHFFPHALSQDRSFQSIDGIWNLVLACVACNSGSGGKAARIPTIRLLERLEIRNNFLISSHHPLRETLINQTGATASKRRQFLNDYHRRSLACLFHSWEPKRDSDTST